MQNCLDWSQCRAVESIPGKVSGAWARFEEPECLCRRFSTIWKPDEVKAVIHFASQSLAKAPEFG